MINTKERISTSLITRHMFKWLTLSITLFLTQTGCASLATLYIHGDPIDNNPCKLRNYAYGGVYLDYLLIKNTFSDESEMSDVYFGAIATIDIIPSAIGDTLLLPVTIPADKKLSAQCESYKMKNLDKE